MDMFSRGALSLSIKDYIKMNNRANAIINATFNAEFEAPRGMSPEQRLLLHRDKNIFQNHIH